MPESPENEILTFTAYAQQALALARKEADYFDHHYVAPEHLLSAIVKLSKGDWGRTIQNIGITVEDVRAAIEALPKRGDSKNVGIISYTDEAKKVFASAGKAAKGLKQGQVGVEHLFLGLLEKDQVVPQRILNTLNVDIRNLRNEILNQFDREAILGKVVTPWMYGGGPIDQSSLDQFSIWIDTGEASIDELTELFSSISDLNRAFGGSGLLFVKDQQQNPIILSPA